MNLENYEEVAISREHLAKQLNFLKDNLELTASFYEGKLLTINLPAFVNFKIIHTEAAIKGDAVKAGTKSAMIETNYKIQVPLFIKEGDIIKVDTRTGKYIERIS
jgi:elongation factor P